MTDVYSQKPNLYTIKNASGMKVTLMDWGATIISIKVPLGNNESEREMLLGLKDAKDWASQKCFFNATIGRYANRIAHSSFKIGEKKYVLESGADHCLHGGIDGFDKRRFEVLAQADDAITFTISSKDGDQGFPGNFNLVVDYKVQDDNTLMVKYHATCDQTCPVCITNHAYFNLNGKNSSILNHTLYINSDKMLELDNDSIPTGKVLDLKENSAFDFRVAKKIGLDFMNHEQMQACRGYDHPYLLDGDGSKPFARATSDDGKVSLELFTDYPATQFYSGNYIHAGDPIIARDDGKVYGNQTGFCLEPEFYPDSPNLKEFATKNPIVDATHPLDKFIAYKFCVNK